jgi:hypothetical protein
LSILTPGIIPLLEFWSALSPVNIVVVALAPLPDEPFRQQFPTE